MLQKPQIVRLSATNYRKYSVFLTFWWPFCVLPIWMKMSPNIERYLADSHSSPANYVKTMTTKV